MQKDVLATGQAMELQQNQYMMGAKEDRSERGSRKSSCSSSLAMRDEMNVHSDCVDGDRLVGSTMTLSGDDEQGSYVPSGLYVEVVIDDVPLDLFCLLYTSPSPRDRG